MKDVTVRPSTTEPAGIGGWLLVYLIALAALAVHGLGLTIAALIISARPALAGLDSFVPMPSLVLYVTSNLVLVVYTVVLYTLMVGKRKSAIVHNVVFNALSVAFLLSWHILGMKSSLGTVIDALPAAVGAWYIVASKRAANTFVRT